MKSWLFRESLIPASAVDKLFARFYEHLSRSGYFTKDGQTVDSTIISAPRQQNCRDEKEVIKTGECPQDCKDKLTKLALKDRDAHWALTNAATHDGAERRNVMTEGNTASMVWADSAYRSKTNEKWFKGQG